MALAPISVPLPPSQVVTDSPILAHSGAGTGTGASPAAQCRWEGGKRGGAFGAEKGGDMAPSPFRLAQ